MGGDAKRLRVERSEIEPGPSEARDASKNLMKRE
jgi:hypothetical protein